MGLFERHRSFEARLSGLVALAVGVAIALAALASYLLVDHQLHSQVQHELASQERTIKETANFGPQAQTAAFRYANNAGERVQLVTATGQILQAHQGEFGTQGTDSTGFTPTKAQRAMAAGRGPDTLYTDQMSGETLFRVLTIRVKYCTSGPFCDTPAAQTIPAILQIGRSLSDVNRALADLRLILALVTAGGIAVALAIGTAIARATIRPVERLREAAEHVAATQSLDATIEQEGEDELGRLAQAFNAMLAALRLSRQQQAQLVSDAGHELRTPLTSLRTNVEFLMRARNLPEDERRELLDDVRDQLEELTSLVGDIVETARQDEHAHVEPTEARLDAIVERALDRARRRAPALAFEVALTPGSVRANPTMLERAILNVLDNAAKWSPPGGAVGVTLTRNGSWVLEVRDHGPGIDPEDLPHVFDRFYRAASARSMPGSGLGLAIVRDVVTAHGGTVEALRPDAGGTLVRIMLPTVEEDEPADAAGDWDGYPPADTEESAVVAVPPPPPPVSRP